MLKPVALALWSLTLFLPDEGASAGGIPGCLPPIIETRAEVAGIAENGALRLKDGRGVRIEGLLWPGKGGADPAAALRHLLAGRTVTLRAREPKLDRYRRLRAQIVLQDGRWLQQALLLQGLARVSIAPDRPDCASELYAAEAQARRLLTGLWALPAYAIRSAISLRWSDLGTFQVVEGKVLSAKVTSNRAYLNFGHNWRTDFTVTIGPDGLKRFRGVGIDPYSYTGKRVRVRGWIDRMNGFEIEASTPAQIEVLRPE